MPRLLGSLASLAEILASGGVAWVVRKVQAELDPRRIIGEILGRFPRLSPVDAQTIATIARTAFEAGLEFGRRGVVDLAMIPVNPYLFGDQPDRRRFEYATNVNLEPQHPAQPEWYVATVETATPWTLEQVVSQAYVEAVDKFRDKYPWIHADPILIGVTVSHVQRRY